VRPPVQTAPSSCHRQQGEPAAVPPAPPPTPASQSCSTTGPPPTRQPPPAPSNPAQHGRRSCPQPCSTLLQHRQTAQDQVITATCLTTGILFAEPQFLAEIGVAGVAPGPQPEPLYQGVCCHGDSREPLHMRLFATARATRARDDASYQLVRRGGPMPTSVCVVVCSRAAESVSIPV
jgi:hypothetical protein